MATLLSAMSKVGSGDVIMVGEGPYAQYLNAAASDTIDGIRKRIQEEELSRDWPELLGSGRGRPNPGDECQGKGKLSGKGKARE